MSGNGVMGAEWISVEEFLEDIEIEIIDGIRTGRRMESIFGFGKSGIGKTEGLQGLAKKLAIGFIDIRLAEFTEVDLKGVPSLDANGMTQWHPTVSLPREERDGEVGILLLDEITGASNEVRLAGYKLIRQGELEGYKVPPHWIIVCCGNNEEDAGEVYSNVSAPLLNGGRVYNLMEDVNSFKNWGLNNDIHPSVLAFISWDEKSLHTYNADEPNRVFASPRSWSKVSRHLHDYESGINPKMTDKLLKRRIVSCIGDTSAKFFAFDKHRAGMADVEGIINGTAPAASRTIALEAAFLTNQNVASKLSNIIRPEKAQIDNGSLREYSATTIIKVANSIKWILTLPKLELQVSGVRDIIHFVGKEPMTEIAFSELFIANCKEFDEFVENNSEIFTA